MRTTMKYLFRGILFLIGMVAFCVLAGEPSDDAALADVFVTRVLGVGVLCGVVLCYFRTMSKEEYDDMMNEEV